MILKSLNRGGRTPPTPNSPKPLVYHQQEHLNYVPVMSLSRFRSHSYDNSYKENNLLKSTFENVNVNLDKNELDSSSYSIETETSSNESFDSSFEDANSSFEDANSVFEDANSSSIESEVIYSELSMRHMRNSVPNEMIILNEISEDNLVQLNWKIESDLNKMLIQSPYEKIYCDNLIINEFEQSIQQPQIDINDLDSLSEYPKDHVKRNRLDRRRKLGAVGLLKLNDKLFYESSVMPTI